MPAVALERDVACALGQQFAARVIACVIVSLQMLHCVKKSSECNVRMF